MSKVKDLINRDTLIDLLEAMAAEAEELNVVDDDEDSESYYNGLVDALQCAEGIAPEFDVKPVVHAKWERLEDQNEMADSWWTCGNCHHFVNMSMALRYFKYCPECGARMDIDEELNEMYLI